MRLTDMSCNIGLYKLGMAHWLCMLCLALLSSKADYAQEFSFECLKAGRLPMTRRDVDVNAAWSYGNRLNSFYALSRHRARLLHIPVDTANKVYHFCNDSLQEQEVNNQVEYISVYGRKFNLDSLLAHSANGSGHPCRNHISFGGTSYTFNLKGRSFIAMHAQQRNFTRDGLLCYIVLLEVSNKRITNIFSFEDCPEDSADCFGDFNNEGNLDFADWRKKELRIMLYTLKGNKFIKDEQHYIVVSPTPAQAAYQAQWDDKFNYAQIDTVNTRWFYRIW